MITHLIAVISDTVISPYIRLMTLMAMGGSESDEEGLFQTERVKGHGEMIYRMRSHQNGVRNRQLKLKVKL